MKEIADNGRIIIELVSSHLMKLSPPLHPDWIAALPVSTALYEKLSKIQLKLVALLVEASAEGDLFFVKDLVVNYKLDVDSCHTSKDGVTALQAACRYGHCDIVEWLLKNAADLEIPDDKGRRAIHHAVKGYGSLTNTFVLHIIKSLFLVTEVRLTLCCT